MLTEYKDNQYKDNHSMLLTVGDNSWLLSNKYRAHVDKRMRKRRQLTMVDEADVGNTANRLGIRWGASGAPCSV